MIDLDAAPPDPVAVTGRGRLWPVGVLCLVAGVLLGGLAVDRWQERSRAAAVSVVVLIDASAWLDDSARASATAGRRVTAVALVRHVTVVNTGPAAVDLLGIAADQPGLILLSLGDERRIEPGATLPAAVRFEVGCAASRSLLSVPGTLKVRTGTGDRRDLPVKLGGDLWVRQVEEICAGPA